MGQSDPGIRARSRLIAAQEFVAVMLLWRPKAAISTLRRAPGRA
jgi:hypothetical protein